MEKEVFIWIQECEFMSTSDTPNAYKNPLCSRCTYTQRSHISIFSASDIGRPDGVFFHKKRISSLCGTCLHLGSVGSNHSTKNPKWHLGQKSPPMDNFMGSLRNFLEISRSGRQLHGKFKELHIYLTAAKSREILFLERGWEEKSEEEHSSLSIMHIDPSSK